MRAAFFKDGVTGRHVLGFMLAFYAVIFTVTGTFLWLAVRTHPGGEAAAYQKGLRYNDVIAEAARQDRLGWRVSARYDAADGRLAVSILDRDGRALPGRRVEASLGRPATTAFDRRAALEQGRDGIYAAPLFLDAGSWTVDLRIDPEGPGEPYKERLRLWVQPKP